MEVKLGFKQTDAGVIPDEWEARPFLQTLHIANGQVDPKSEPYKSMVLVAPDHIESRTGRLLQQRTASDQHAISGKYLFSPDDIVYSKIRPYLRKAILANFSGLCSADMYPLTAAQDVVPAYAFAVILSQRFSRFAEAVSVRSGIPKINREELADFVVALPPVCEQESIAAALSDIDNLLTVQEELIAKKRNVKQATMQKLLTGKRRLSGFNEVWVVKSLETVAEIQSGGTPSTTRSEFWDGDVLWCTPTDITALKGYKYLTQTSRTITSEGLKFSSAELIPAHSIVMTSRATIGECAINSVPVSTNQGFKNFIPHESTDHEFLYYLLATKKQEFISLCGGSTFLEIGKGQLASFTVKLPIDKVEQTAIAAVLSDMDAEIAALEQKQAKTRALKQGMMQELLTGRVRFI